MTPRSRMSRATFSALADGGGGVAGMRCLVRARRSRTLQLVRYIADRRPEAREAFDAVKSLPAAAVHRVVDHPAVGEWATRTALGRASPAGLAFVAAAAAVHAGTSLSLELPPADRPRLPTLGVVKGRPSGKVSVDGLAWEPTPRVVMRDGTVFLVEKWAVGGQPAELRVAAGVDVARWQEVVSGAWELLSRDHADVAAEFATAVTVLTPLAEPRSGMSSATHADAFGCVFMSLSADPAVVAMTLAHELQHTKLVALMDLFPLVVPDSGERFYAPWRDDPRPAIGLLHGAYAHLGVAGFCRRAGREVEFARWRAASLRAARTLLGGAVLTALGREFVTGMAATLSRWCAEPVSPAAQTRADRLAAAHRARWSAAGHGAPG
ncbi:aKG-HExxH-type peptide beta-hydroxylase [Saccharothrix obliqua]|uniref:aKG-HExxH-type peptide beta-hydroxylase n=1 Tax=Saccharothrix obliqua TaxID=2861747 RepID=UPI001C5F95F8|nr:HEXXH motif-containing putative peptide modification protein [Saccharothrix obliqua]MBW4718176.1 hypothetical protein [Saccharothrix obliqua]